VKTIASITDLAADVSGFVKKAEAEGVVPISRNGRTVAFMVSRDKMAAILETMELQKSAELMSLIRQHKAGKLKFTEVPDEI
jgi:prevent-host-death family protein